MIEDFNEMIDDNEEEILYAIRPNKTGIKRDIALVLKIAEQLTCLSVEQLMRFTLPERLHEVISRTSKMPPKTARKREMKYITAQLRKLELAPIQEQLDRYNSTSIHAVREHHQAEKWRDKLILSEDKALLTQFLTHYPQANAQQLRQLQRNAKKESLAEKPPKSARLLYQYLKQLFETSDL
jgi:ribosome-associated protein